MVAFTQNNMIWVGTYPYGFLFKKYLFPGEHNYSCQDIDETPKNAFMLIGHNRIKVNYCTLFFKLFLHLIIQCMCMHGTWEQMCHNMERERKRGQRTTFRSQPFLHVHFWGLESIHQATWHIWM